MNTLWLASGSPRRATLLTWAGIPLEVHPSHVDERRSPGAAPIAHALDVTKRKAEAAQALPGRTVLTADTIVHHGDLVLGKPESRAQAEQLLTSLSGRWHKVTTAVCVRSTTTQLFHVTTRVRFRTLTGAEIRAYVATGEADDKAGAYGIQGRAGSFVAELIGSWTNVMGLPMEQTLQALNLAGITPTHV